MFIFPIRSDRPQRTLPWVNYALIAANVVVYILTMSRQGEAWKNHFLLNPSAVDLWHHIPYQFITYQFLHQGWMHILGNMLFLYVFGNSVEDRLGKLGYLCFYLAGGVVAGLGHMALEGSPVLGASGAVCAVTGAYLALFPLSNVTLFYWIFIFIDTFEVLGIYLILFQVGQNLLLQMMDRGGVAYMAHLAGYAFGFAVGMGLLWARLLPREPYDLLSMIAHRRRRAKFEALTRQGYRPWENQVPSTSPVATDGNASDHAKGVAGKRSAELRQEIDKAMADHDVPTAAARYHLLLEIDPTQVMSQQEQLDLANQLTADGRYASAARAYELFLKTYTSYPQLEQIQLILGLIYARYLRQTGRAKELIAAAQPKLTDAAQLALAEQLLREVG